ncbi:MAG TPA: DUF2726 domain-containing protein [Methylibium sp.]|nr:DUF2726 domain-containing protein [Methylibium sp.]
MNPIVLVALLLVLALGLWWWRRGRGNAGDDGSSRPQRGEALDTVAGWPPEPTRLLTAVERRAMTMLEHALPEYMILAQVPLARFIRVPTRNSYTEWMRRVGQLCADLLVCDGSSQVVAIVELRRPPGKDTERTRKRHARMDRVLRKAGIRVLVWNEEALPHPDAVREQVLPKPKVVEAAPPVAAAPVAAAATTAGAAAAAAAAGKLPFGDTEPDPDEVFELREPPASTWFDELDSGPTPLDPPRR